MLEVLGEEELNLGFVSDQALPLRLALFRGRRHTSHSDSDLEDSSLSPDLLES
jgi:hypothetical protein